MALLDDVASACRRLAPAGWGELLAAHGLDLEAADPGAELLRELPGIDRGRPGFEDFAPEGRRGLEPGVPARSLLYHALASPGVLLGADGAELQDFPTLSELESVENLVFALAATRLAELTARFPRAPMAVVVFAHEYRPGAETVHRRHADLCFSRTGVARVGTAEAHYDRRGRGFLPFVEDDPHGFRVLPSRYAPYVAVELPGEEALFGPMNFDLRLAFNDEPQPGDAERSFWVPLHKLFSGPECLAGLDLSLTLEARHVNEKLRRVHRQLRALGHDTGWEEPNIDQAPFVFTDGIAELSTELEAGNGLLVPTAHPALIEAAVYEGEPLTFIVPSQPDNEWAPSLQIRSEGGVRRAPEYVHARHLVEGVSVRSLNAEPEVAEVVRAGGYRARHYLDFTGDGWVEALCPQLAAALPRSVPAYSVVTAPDFYPNCDQRELIEWWVSRVPRALRRAVWQTPPFTLSDERMPPNLQLPGAPFRPEDAGVSAIVSLPSEGEATSVHVGTARTERHAHLPDGAAGVFAPGWDTSHDETDGVTHLASYGLGSPFPEDAKLCAALSSFWPAVAPDAGRSFSTPFATATPLTDEEIGSVGELPWDGVAGPRLVELSGQSAIEYARFEHVDYVESALEGRFSLALTGQVDVEEYTARVLAMTRCYAALSLDPGDGSWRITSFLSSPVDDAERGQAESEAGGSLGPEAFRVVFSRALEELEGSGDHRLVRLGVGETVTLFAGALPRVLVGREGEPWRLVRTD